MVWTANKLGIRFHLINVINEDSFSSTFLLWEIKIWSIACTEMWTLSSTMNLKRCKGMGETRSNASLGITRSSLWKLCYNQRKGKSALTSESCHYTRYQGQILFVHAGIYLIVVCYLFPLVDDKQVTSNFLWMNYLQSSIPDHWDWGKIIFLNKFHSLIS